MRRIALILLLSIGGLTVGCGPEVHREFTGVSFGGAGTYYPGDEVTCQEVERCSDVLAEVEAFIAEHYQDRGPASVTLHSTATADGPADIQRSGGSTWMAVVKFNDGSRTALIVGCGVGIAQDLCFSQDALGRSHDSFQSER